MISKVSKSVRARFIGYRGGKSTQYNKYALIRVENVENKREVAVYIGRKAVWHSKSGSRLIGRVVSIHGRGGTLEVRFRKGLPGEAVGTEIALI